MSRIDLVLFGATGFVGRQAARYLAEHAPASLSVGLAARSADKLEALAASLNREVELLVVDVSDPASVDDMARRARVLLTTVGPYARYGDPVVDACVEHGTHYLDITGEVPWVQQVIARHHARAAAEGTVLVPFSGFDSVPSDLAAWMAVDWLRRERGTGTRWVRVGFVASGGINGGTLASALHMAEDQSIAGYAPGALAPDMTGVEVQDRPATPWIDGKKLAPFFMGPVNTRVVARSAALARQRGEPWGKHFHYEEGVEAASALAVTGWKVGLGAMGALLSLSPGRALLRRLGPSPGEGPSEEVMDGGFVRARIRAEGEDGTQVEGSMKAKGDPGNRVTAVLLCESALTLALGEGTGRAGVLTPSEALGRGLLERLRGAGMTWEVGDGEIEGSGREQ